MASHDEINRAWEAAARALGLDLVRSKTLHSRPKMAGAIDGFAVEVWNKSDEYAGAFTNIRVDFPEQLGVRILIAARPTKRPQPKRSDVLTGDPQFDRSVRVRTAKQGMRRHPSEHDAERVRQFLTPNRRKALLDLMSAVTAEADPEQLGRQFREAPSRADRRKVLADAVPAKVSVSHSNTMISMPLQTTGLQPVVDTVKIAVQAARELSGPSR